MKPELVCKYYPAQKVFENARQQINLTYGLELTLIEQAELKQYVRPVLTSLGKIEGEICDCDFDPVAEIITRFMMDYYGLPFELAFSHTSTPQSIRGYLERWREFQDFLRIQQERMHMP